MDYSNRSNHEHRPFPRAQPNSDGFQKTSSPVSMDGIPSFGSPSLVAARSAGERSHSFTASHQHSQSMHNFVTASKSQQQQQQQASGSTSPRSSVRPLSAFQPMETPDYNGSPVGPRSPSPQGSTTRSIRSSTALLTFRSQDLRSALSLQDAQQKKLYMEGYLLKRDDLSTDGKPLHVADEKRKWTECFVQLTGTVLSLWNVDQMEQAARQGKEVPPTFINITDAFVDFIGLLVENPNQIPGSRSRYHHAFALNSAGNNRTIFCFRDPPPFPSETIDHWLIPENRSKPEHRAVIGWLNLGHRHLQAWINAIRLASWEKVRLEEIYTGALIRARLGAATSPFAEGQKEAPTPPTEMAIKSPLTKGKMEGWVKARFMGSTEWKKCWMVLTDYRPDEAEVSGKKKFWKIGGAGDRTSTMSISSISNSQSNPNLAGINTIADIPPPPGSNRAPGVANFFDSKKAKKPFASLIYAAHAFAVYPSRPELVEGSSLFKIEGVFPSSSVLSATHRTRMTGWVMIMPELENAASKGSNAEMMKWVIAFMDAFKLYGRPDTFIWDARNPISSFFAYPIGPYKDRLFLDRELAEFLEIAREDLLSSRSSLHGIMSARMRGEKTKILQPLPPPSKQTLEPRETSADQNQSQAEKPEKVVSQDPSHLPELPCFNDKLPPLDFTKTEATGLADSVPMAQQLTNPVSNDRRLSTAPSVSSGFKDNDLGFATHVQRDSSRSQNVSPSITDIPRPAREARPGFSPPQNLVTNISAVSQQSHSDSKIVPVDKAPTSTSPTAFPSSDRIPLSPQAPINSMSRTAEAPSTLLLEAEKQDQVTSSSQSIRSTNISSVEPATASQSTSSLSQDSTAPPPLQIRQPTLPGPSGRGAEQSMQDPATFKRDSDLLHNYDESALFYMASISDQLPAPTNIVHSKPAAQPKPQAEPVKAPQSQPDLEPTKTTKEVVHVQNGHNRFSTGKDTIGDDALAAYSFLQQPPSPLLKTKSISSKPSKADHAAVKETSNTAAPTITPIMATNLPTIIHPSMASFPSTFGQNKKAVERKTAAQLQAQAHQEALSKPGRPGGKNRAGAKAAHAWGDESEDDEEENEEEDDEGGEDELQHRSRGAGVSALSPSNSKASMTQSPELEPQQPTLIPASLSVAAMSSYGDHMSAHGHSGQSVADAGGMPRSRSISPSYAAAQRNMASPPQPAFAGGNRQSVFNSHLGAMHDNDSRGSTPPQTVVAPSRQTFLQLNPEEQPGSMTTVFTPHGLLQAGAQDKAERSAKAQEAEARSTGNHLVSVPNKPPPPQAGLLGAITAHERERKGAGGFGATLTERERERVSAEKRQREEDMVHQQQQQQMLQMSYYNPMMLQQMQMGGMMPGMGMVPGMGMMPGMGMGMGMGGMGGMGMGMPPMRGYAASQMAGSQMGFDPIMAQQQAMQAAQMAYMSAMSQAHQEGSVMGHGTPAAAPASTMGMSMAGMAPFMSAPHMNMMSAPFGGFMAGQEAASEYGGMPTSPRPGTGTGRNGQSAGQRE